MGHKAQSGSGSGDARRGLFWFAGVGTSKKKAKKRELAKKGALLHFEDSLRYIAMRPFFLRLDSFLPPSKSLRSFCVQVSSLK